MDLNGGAVRRNAPHIVQSGQNGHRGRGSRSGHNGQARSVSASRHTAHVVRVYTLHDTHVRTHTQQGMRPPKATPCRAVQHGVHQRHAMGTASLAGPAACSTAARTMARVSTKGHALPGRYAMAQGRQGTRQGTGPRRCVASEHGQHAARCGWMSSHTVPHYHDGSSSNSHNGIRANCMTCDWQCVCLHARFTACPARRV